MDSENPSGVIRSIESHSVKSKILRPDDIEGYVGRIDGAYDISSIPRDACYQYHLGFVCLFV